MKKNMGMVDRVLRISGGAILAGLYVSDIVTGPVGIALLVVAGILILTSLVSFCPLYSVLGLNSQRQKKAAG